VSESGRQVRIKATVVASFVSPCRLRLTGNALPFPSTCQDLRCLWGGTLIIRAPNALSQSARLSLAGPSGALLLLLPRRRRRRRRRRKRKRNKYRPQTRCHGIGAGGARARGGAGALPTRASKVRRGLRCSHDFARLGRPPPPFPLLG